jgi:uncharacterized repeat protein (TIGR01451 family)
LIAGTCAAEAQAQAVLQPGEAVLTRFSGTTMEDGRLVIDPDGAVASIIDLSRPGGPPVGARWPNESQRPLARAADVGQVFGVALDDALPPNIYLTASSAFGLHRNVDNSGWMPGMWGAGGGPGTVWKLNASNGYRPEMFAQIALEGRQNTAAALGNIAFDPRSRQLFVSDLETGMIHRLRLSDGADLGTFDHGTEARTAFLDATDGRYQRLPPVPFNPASAARIDDCPSGDFARTPSCWNLADFRRRIWGLGVRFDSDAGVSRLYYALWSSQGFGNPDFPAAGESEQKNAVWSVAIGADGGFVSGSARREFFLPDFFRSPEAIARAGRSHPVSDIAFGSAGGQKVMLLAERGGLRNLGLAAEAAFAFPHESRVLRYELTSNGIWRPAGRYDTGYYDRGEDGPPYIRAGGAGGVAFGPGYDAQWRSDSANPDALVWATGDDLCSPSAPCADPRAGTLTDASRLSGIQGRAARPYDAFEPVSAFQPYPAPGPATPPRGPQASYMVDAAVDAGIDGPERSDATRIGDIVVHQALPAAGEAAEAAPQVALDETSEADLPGGWPEELPPQGTWPEGLPPEGWYPAEPPEDGWFLPPPLPLDTDLAIRKTGPAQCQEGVECSYVITIRNLGTSAYIGPLAIEDTMPEGATLASASPGWNCMPAGNSFSCITNAPALLAPAAAAAIEVNILLPAEIAGPSVRNCAAIGWLDMGTEDGSVGNDEACTDTPVTEGFDLGITKVSASPDCTENANCGFALGIMNHGPGEFKGSLTVRDSMPAGSTLVIAPGCSPSGDDLTCRIDDITLPPGDTAGFHILLKLPDGSAGTTVENCVRIDWAAMTSDDGPADIHPDQSCVSVNVLDGAGFFDLSVWKQGPAHCDSGGNCTYAITITNNGPDDYTGPIVLRDTPEAGISLVSADPAWTCIPGPTIDCTLNGGPHTLHPGDTRSLSLTLAIPPPPPAAEFTLNCSAFLWGAGGMPADDNPAVGSDDEFDDSCTPTLIDAGFDLQMAKTGPAECYEGAACAFTVSITNNGPKPAIGLSAFNDIFPAGAMLEGVTGEVACNAAAPGTVNCIHLSDWLAPGATKTTSVTVRLPDPVPGDAVPNCAVLNWNPPPPDWYVGAMQTGDDNPANDGPVCATVPILAADLAPWGATACQLGSSCPIKVEVQNRGGRLFKGAAGLRGTLDPGVTISSIRSLTSGFDCRVTGIGTYECDGPSLSLKAASTLQIEMVLEIPADFPHRRIVHRKEMIWPDLAVKDGKPGNDRHTSTIMIVQSEELEAQQPPPAPTAPEPLPPADLAVTKEVLRGSCDAGGPCPFEISVSNQGPGIYDGPLHIIDSATPAGVRLAGHGAAPWSCRSEAGETRCSHPPLRLRPGDSKSLSLTLRTSGSTSGGARNCASLGWSGEMRIMRVQAALNDLGFEAGTVDGKIGSRTRSALRAYQQGAGLPVTGDIDEPVLRQLFGGLAEGDPNPGNDKDCVTFAVQRTVEPGPVCARNQTEVAAARVKALRAQGWRIETVRRGGVTIYCGTPPEREPTPPMVVPPVIVSPALICPPGYEAYRTRGKIPPNSEIIRRTAGDLVYYCARPKPRPVLRCPDGYKTFPSRRAVPKDWELRILREDGREIYCARQKPQVDACPRGWRPVTRERAKALVRQGWEIQQVGKLLCARPGKETGPSEPGVQTCTGGRIWDAKRGACVCPGNSQWNPRLNRCIAPLPGQIPSVPQPRLMVPQ